MKSIRIAVLSLFATTCLAQSANEVVNPENIPPREDSLSTAYRVEVVARGLHVPWSIVILPDKRIFFSERTGTVRVLHLNRLLRAPALTIDVAKGNKMGMLGMAADPHFSENHFLYLAYDYRLEPFDRDKPQFRLRVVRYREQSDHLIDPKVLIEDLPAWSNHTGCRLRFAPDGTLYFTDGDANEPSRAQDTSLMNGKVFRINPDGSIPNDNPFAGQPGKRAEIWSYGHRNPQGLDFQPETGKLIETEHGPLGGDEINWIDKGANYGWPVVDHRNTRVGMRSPLLEFSPSIAPGSASFYRGFAFPELRGNLLVACLRGEGILRVQFGGGQPRQIGWLLHRTFGRIRDIAETPEGYLYISTSQQDPDEGHPRPGEEDDLLLRIVPASLARSELPAYKPSKEWLETVELEQKGAPAGSVEATIGRKCASCHGPHLRDSMPVDVVNHHWRYALDDAALRHVILYGIAEKAMPAAHDLSGKEVGQLVDYLRAQSNARPHK